MPATSRVDAVIEGSDFSVRFRAFGLERDP
jgi:hypothetical protein